MERIKVVGRHQVPAEIALAERVTRGSQKHRSVGQFPSLGRGHPVLRGRNRAENEAFAAFRGGLAWHVTFAAPAKGNERKAIF